MVMFYSVQTTKCESFDGKMDVYSENLQFLNSK